MNDIILLSQPNYETKWQMLMYKHSRNNWKSESFGEKYGISEDIFYQLSKLDYFEYVK